MSLESLEYEYWYEIVIGRRDKVSLPVLASSQAVLPLDLTRMELVGVVHNDLLEACYRSLPNSVRCDIAKSNLGYWVIDAEKAFKHFVESKIPPEFEVKHLSLSNLAEEARECGCRI